MPSSNAIIKAENVKLLRSYSTSAPLPDVKNTGSSRKTTGSEGKGTTHQNEEQSKWLQISSAFKKESYEKGFAEGLEFRKKEFVAAIAAMTAAVTELRTLKKKHYAEKENEILDLVLAVARKVIHTETTINRNVALEILREAVKNINDEGGLKVHLHPDDLRFVMEMKKELLKENEIFNNAVFESDAGLERGGVLLETEHLEVDARLDHQFEKIKEVFKK
jgi:flagellar assembly protein FliH